MKTPQQVLADVRQRLLSSWAATLTGTADPVRWPHAFAIGEARSSALAADTATMTDGASLWRTWDREHELRADWCPRTVAGTHQELPTHLPVPDIDAAAALVGEPWPARLQRGRARAAVLAARYGHLVAPDRVLKSVDEWADVDFALLCAAADWFAAPHPPGLTPRQVPVPGMHAKWLNTRQSLVREVAGVEHLDLAAPHPARIHFTYLDPTYLASGGRIHDSASVGDTVTLPYVPRIVLISENKDTAINFPPLAGAVAIEGAGSGGKTFNAFDWVRRAPHLIYWGDMDADGLEILNGFRQDGLPVRSILMDRPTYRHWERFGTNYYPNGRPITARPARQTPKLHERERGLYLDLVSEAWTLHRRVEQERIPMSAALAAIDAAITEGSAP